MHDFHMKDDIKHTNKWIKFTKLFTYAKIEHTATFSTTRSASCEEKNIFAAAFLYVVRMSRHYC